MFGTEKLCRYGAIALALFLSGTVLAGQKHLSYARTMDDLREARVLLQRTNQTPGADGSQDEVSLSLNYIDAAMTEIYKETGEQGEKPSETPRVDARMPWAKRLSKSLKMLEKAQLDCNAEKGNGGDDGLRSRVLEELDHAHSRLSVALQTVNFDYSARNMPTRND
jgi:hypothetical protein